MSMQLVDPTQDHSSFEFIETFAGQAAATRMFRKSNFRSARLDLEYMTGEPDRQNPMDLCTDAGMVNLDYSL